MGKVVVEKKRKKKKGRPSLLDLQKRSLKQQKQLLKKHNKNQNNNNLLLLNSNTNIIKNTNNKNNINITSKKSPPPPPPPPRQRNPNRRSTRRNPNPNPNSDDDGEDEEEDEDDELEDGEDDDDDDDDGGNSGKDESTPDGIEGRSLRKRKIDSISNGSGASLAVDDKLQVEKQSIAVINQTNTDQGSSKQDDAPFTPLPDTKLLLFILDRLQKKDTYGVFAEPVDQEELPDYHEIIEQPMDFSTVRKKLEDASYGNLEQFEKDIFLICSNAMQYNGPDTIYFRQACSIQELAKKHFENLRQDSDDNEIDPEPKVVRRGRPPKHLKRPPGRPPGRPPLVRANSNFSEATLATAGGTTNRSNSELRKGSPHLEKYGSTDSFTRSLLGSRNSEAYLGRPAERFDRPDDMIGSSSKGSSMKHGKRQIVLDENKRNTYKHSCELASRHEPSVLTTFHVERKQLIAVGLHTEYGYARSLARFAAKLGPVAWKVASKKIERCLPSGVKFGPGWIGENEAPTEKPLQDLPNASGPTQDIVESGVDMSEQKPQVEQLSNVHKPAVPAKLNNELNKAISTTTSGGDSSSVSSAIIHQSPTIQSRLNGVNGSYGLNFAAQMVKMVGAARPSMLDLQPSPSIVTVSRTESHSTCPPSTDNGHGEAKLPANSSTIKAGDGTAPPDLNVGFQSPGSPSSGKTDPVQPDLALQL